MKSLSELTSSADPAIHFIREWTAAAKVQHEILPPAATRDETLLALQVSTHSVLGAVAYETGGILIDHGWLRLLGSSHPRLTRTMPDWNADRSNGFFLVADDAVGGFFALNGGALGSDHGNAYYFAPDSLRWESLKMTYSQFVGWTLSGGVEQFYTSLRWPSWREDTAQLHGDRAFFFYPPLFTKEGQSMTGRRGDVPIAESWGAQMDFIVQLGQR